jgi:hypothetical protein
MHVEYLSTDATTTLLDICLNSWGFSKSVFGHFLFFLCFALVQNCEIFPPAKGKNKQALKNKTACACRMDVKQRYQQKKKS